MRCNTLFVDYSRVVNANEVIVMACTGHDEMQQQASKKVWSGAPNPLSQKSSFIVSLPMKLFIVLACMHRPIRCNSKQASKKVWSGALLITLPLLMLKEQKSIFQLLDSRLVKWEEILEQQLKTVQGAGPRPLSMMAFGCIIPRKAAGSS
jgi:hypothetical protein